MNTLRYGILDSKKSFAPVEITISAETYPSGYSSMEFNEYGYACNDNQIEVTSNAASWSATGSGSIKDYLNIGGAGVGLTYYGSGNEIITITCTDPEGETPLGSIFFQAVGGNSTYIAASAGVGCT